MRRLDDRANGHDVSFRDNVLLHVVQIRKGVDDRPDQPGNVFATFDGPQGTAVPLHIRCQQGDCFICLVLVERRLDELANDPLVFLELLGRGHLAVPTLWRVGAHEDRLGWPVDPWHRADDSFWAGASTGMTYSPARNDLEEDVPRLAHFPT